MERNFDIWIKGYDAYDEGKELSDNPYIYGTDGATAWQYGWFAGQEDEQHRESLEKYS